MQLFLAVTIALVGQGCRLAQNAWQTTVAEPVHYARNLDAKLSRKHFTNMAVTAFEEARARMRAELDDYRCEPFTVDYERGFIDGFVDYLDAGGTGTPPAHPPRRYWKARYQNPVGQAFVNDWFRGYEHGALVARESNYRSYVTVPLTDEIAGTTIPVYGRIFPIPSESNQVDEPVDEPVAADRVARLADDVPSRATVRRLSAVPGEYVR